MKQVKLEKRVRQEQILVAALDLAQKTHYRGLTRAEVAARAGVPPSLLTYHFGTMEQFYRAVMRAAVRLENLSVIAQGLVQRDRQALKAPDNLQARALASLSKAH